MKTVISFILSLFKPFHDALFAYMVKTGMAQCAIALEINKTVSVFKQTGLGVPRSGGGGQALRREKSSGKLTIAFFENNEITQHQQSTGKTTGGRSASFALNGLLSGNTYSTLLASLLRKLFTATTAFAASTITISGSSALWTFTASIAAPLFLTNGLKVGDVIRLSAAGGTAGNKANNIMVVGVTSETVFTGVTLNASVLTAEAIVTCTTTVVGKKAIAAATAQTNDYWTAEEWQSDIAQSELFTDTVFSSADINLPADNNASIAFNAVALQRATAGAQVLTAPTAETTTTVVSGVKGIVMIQGAAIANVTSAAIKIDGQAEALGAVLGKNVAPDVKRDVLKVSGTLTAFYENGTMSGYFDANTPISVAIVTAVDSTNASEFISFVMSKVKLEGDDKDDGQKGVIRTYPFTAEINGAGGATLANDKTILSIQDSLAA